MPEISDEAIKKRMTTALMNEAAQTMVGHIQPDDARRLVLAVLRTMKSPTKRMVIAGGAFVYFEGHTFGETGSADVWDAMIEAALEE